MTTTTLTLSSPSPSLCIFVIRKEKCSQPCSHNWAQHTYLLCTHIKHFLSRPSHSYMHIMCVYTFAFLTPINCIDSHYQHNKHSLISVLDFDIAIRYQSYVYLIKICLLIMHTHAHRSLIEREGYSFNSSEQFSLIFSTASRYSILIVRKQFGGKKRSERNKQIARNFKLFIAMFKYF